MNRTVVHTAPPSGETPEEVIRQWRRGLLSDEELVSRLMTEIEWLRNTACQAQSTADSMLTPWPN